MRDFRRRRRLFWDTLLGRPISDQLPFMRVGVLGLEALFAYAEIAGRTDVGYQHFYTCNISLHKEFLSRTVDSTKTSKLLLRKRRFGF